MRERDPLKRIASKVTVSADGCWLWTSSVDERGYARMGGGALGHRVTYELVVGPIPDGLQIDHLCRVRNCVNPEHLEAVTCRVNLHRGETVTAMHAAKTQCVNGHDFTPENTYVWRGCRHCRKCRAARMRAKRQAAATPATTANVNDGLVPEIV